MRLIDAESPELLAKLRFIREAEQQIYGRESWGFTAKCEHVIDSAPTIQPTQPEPHWIPVDLENNKPPLEEWVLVSSDGYVMQDCIVERGGKKIWYHGGNIQSDDRYMPLPEPYKGVTT